MAGDGARAQFRLRAEPAKLVDCPANHIVNAVPNDRIGKQAGVSTSLDRFDPGANRVGMDDESASGLLDAPAAQPLELQYRQSLLRKIIRPSMRRHGLAMGAENVQF